MSVRSRLLAEDLDWFSPRHPRVREIPPQIRDWLSETGSLTARLEAVVGNVQVQVLYQGSGRAFPSEVQWLRSAQDRCLWVREVILAGRHGPLVAARTVAPGETLRGEGVGFERLGDRPLGALLFSHPAVERGDSQWVRLAPSAWRMSSVEAPRWGRRTLYYVDGSPLLVGEFFLPSLFHIARHDESSLG